MVVLIAMNHDNNQASPMIQDKMTIISLFRHATDSSKRFLSQLVQQSFSQLGQKLSLGIIEQWQILSRVLNTANKLNCLHDKNCRLLIIEFINQEAVEKYRTSYFNHAKISEDYLSQLKSIGAYQFIEVMKIVNKLTLIEKYFRQKMEMNTISESHIDKKIRVLMSLCLSRRRSDNNNLLKFKAIVAFQDRIELIKQLGKLLRQAWKIQKRNKKIQQDNNQMANSINLYEEEDQLGFL